MRQLAKKLNGLKTILQIMAVAKEPVKAAIEVITVGGGESGGCISINTYGWINFANKQLDREQSMAPKPCKR